MYADDNLIFFFLKKRADLQQLLKVSQLKSGVQYGLKTNPEDSHGCGQTKEEQKLMFPFFLFFYLSKQELKIKGKMVTRVKIRN